MHPLTLPLCAAGTFSLAAQAQTAGAPQPGTDAVAAYVSLPRPPGVDRARLVAEFRSAVPTYQKVPGLLRKYFTIADVDPALLARARGGDLGALDALLGAIQGGIYNLAVRMLGNREDARDATQEILLKVTTHLGAFRGEAAFSTWVYQVARNHLLTASTRTRESPEVSLEALGQTLQAGIEFGRGTWDGGASLTPEDKAAAREMAVTCTQAMLMRLDRPRRLAYILDVVFGLPSQHAAMVLQIEAPAYRQRVSRARRSLQAFSRTACGRVSSDAECRCDKQVHALRLLKRQGVERVPELRLAEAERQTASEALDQVLAMSDIAAVLRSHPQYRAPQAMIAAIRAVVAQHDSPSPRLN